MKEIENIWVVIAGYNEAAVIRSVVEDVRRIVPQVVLVDDCSRDATREEALKGGAVVVRHPINRGQGAALQTGMTYALRQGADVIIHFDADGQHQSADIPKFLDAIHEGFDVVTGSRFLDAESNVPFSRKLVLKCGILFTWFFSGLKLTDTHNGFRALSRKAAEQIRIRENRMAHASEILHEIVRLRLTYKEVPTTIRYTDYSKSRGQSSWNAVSIVWRIIWRTLFLS
ncbi:MAG: glycosyltransferase family 2 protein [bacterium]|nr:glycosyltransferase family 2 protein [bacterium]